MNSTPSNAPDFNAPADQFAILGDFVNVDRRLFDLTGNRIRNTGN